MKTNENQWKSMEIKENRLIFIDFVWLRWSMRQASQPQEARQRRVVPQSMSQYASSAAWDS